MLVWDCPEPLARMWELSRCKLSYTLGKRLNVGLIRDDEWSNGHSRVLEADSTVA